MQTEQKKVHKHDESERDANGLIPRPKNPIGVDEAIRIFVERVQEIEYVNEIRCVKQGANHEIWTIITMPRGKYELMSPIIKVEGDLLRRMEDFRLGFRIVDRGVVSYENALSGSSLLWKRSNAS